MEKTMTTEEAGKVLAVTPKTIRRWIKSGVLSGSQTPAGWRLTPEDVAEFLARHRHRGPASERGEGEA